MRPGAFAGLIAGLVTIIVSGLLRLVAGIPLPVELVSDRFLPFVPVESFVFLLGLSGGPLLAKQLAFYSTFLLLLAFGALLGNIFAALGRRRLLVLAGGAAALWLLALAVLWPALASSYRGDPPGQAALLSAGGLALTLVAFAGSLVLAERRL